MINIIFPLYFHPFRLGYMKYPKEEGLIKIYVANHSAICKGEIDKICSELSKTTIEELIHVFDRCPSNHNFEKVLESLV